ncbi:MAG: hypothetical protein HYS34_04135 [Acidobacteria bacterium]|nr:hypothetical protein [Acidobacteriota bacterium]
MTFGFACLDDHARERFGRSGRWLRDLAALGRALGSLPGLAAALTGEEGGRPPGRVAALLIGRVASAATLDRWIALVRSVTSFVEAPVASAAAGRRKSTRRSASWSPWRTRWKGGRASCWPG